LARSKRYDILAPVAVNAGELVGLLAALSASTLLRGHLAAQHFRKAFFQAFKALLLSGDLALSFLVEGDTEFGLCLLDMQPPRARNSASPASTFFAPDDCARAVAPVLGRQQNSVRQA
jgi:hypothetical protein